MAFVLVLLTLITMGGCAANAQPNTVELDSSRKAANAIDESLGSMRVSTVDLETGSDRGGELTIYRTGSNVVRIDATIGLSNADVKHIFYYQQERLIAAKTQEVKHLYSSEKQELVLGAGKRIIETEYFAVDGHLFVVSARRSAAPTAASRLQKEGEYLFRAVMRGQSSINIEKLLK
jgi:hypothetical protein